MSAFFRDPKSGLLIPKRSVLQNSATRRTFLQGVAASSLVPLLGCSTDDTPNADTGLDTTSDGGVDAGGDVSADTAVDTASDVAMDAAGPTTFRFAVIGDTHIIDEYYTGPESNQLDTESMFETESRLRAVRDRIRNLETPVDFVIHVGDLIHDYPDGDLEFMATNTTRFDTAKALMESFGVPFHMCFGNHDYEFRRVSREDTHAFFEEGLGVAPYSAFDHMGWKFIQLNSYTGETHAWEGEQGRDGSLGETQLLWLEAQLQEEKPTFIFIHQMLQIMKKQEVGDFGLHGLLDQYKDNIAYVLAGHTHRWIDLGDNYGPPHRVIGATRYDEDCFVIAEVDVSAGTSRFVNQESWTEFTVNADRWDEA